MNEGDRARPEQPASWLCTPKTLERSRQSRAGVEHSRLQLLKPSLVSGWEVLEGKVDNGPAAPSAGPRGARGVSTTYDACSFPTIASGE